MTKREAIIRLLQEETDVKIDYRDGIIYKINDMRYNNTEYDQFRAEYEKDKIFDHYKHWLLARAREYKKEHETKHTVEEIANCALEEKLKNIMEFTDKCYDFGKEHEVILTRVDFDKEFAYFVNEEGIEYRAAFDVIKHYYKKKELLEELMEEYDND